MAVPPKKSRQRVVSEHIDDQARNERQKTTLLLEHRRILKGKCTNLIAGGLKAAEKTKELIADSKRHLEKANPGSKKSKTG